MSTWHSYPKVYQLGHREVRPIFDAPVAVEEKIDGSQFSFGLIDGALRMRSKNQEIDANNPDSLFRLACESVHNRAGKLTPDWAYRGEYLAKPKHNVLNYGRVPEGNIIIFDIEPAEGEALLPAARDHAAAAIGLESVRAEYWPDVSALTADFIPSLLDQESGLGAVKYEGVVFKSFTLYGGDKKRLVAKFVSQAFKEIAKDNPNFLRKPHADVVAEIGKKYGTEARWRKSVQTMRDGGTLVEGPQDIGPLIRAVIADVDGECAEEIAAALYSHFQRDILKKVAVGLPEWYKTQLLALQFAEAAE